MLHAPCLPALTAVRQAPCTKLRARCLVASIHFSKTSSYSKSSLISKNTQPPAPCLPALMTGSMLHARSLVASIHFSERQGNPNSALMSKNTQPPAPCLLMTGPMLHAPCSMPHALTTHQPGRALLRLSVQNCLSYTRNLVTSLFFG